MADDNLFPGDHDPPADGETPPVEGGTALTAEAVQNIIQESLTSATAPLQQAVQGVAERLGNLEQAQRPPAPEEPPPGAGADDVNKYLEGLMADGEATVKGTVESVVQEKVAPAIGLAYQGAERAIEDRQRAVVDQEYGKGSWDEVFKPVVDEGKKGMPMYMKAHDESMTQLLLNVKGKLFDDPEMRKALDSRREKVVEGARAPQHVPAMMSGAGRYVDPDSGPNPDEKTFLQALNDKGFKVSLKEYRSWQGRGNTEDDWAPGASK